MRLRFKVLSILLYLFMVPVGIQSSQNSNNLNNQDSSQKKQDENALLKEFIAALKKEHELQFILGFPPFTAYVSWRQIRDNPVTTIGIITALSAAAYLTTEYWYTPIMQWLKDKNEDAGSSNGQSGKDGMADFTKSRARIYKPGDIKIKLKDVAGLEGAKADVYDIMQFLKNPKVYADMGAKIPKGVLMQGAPGNGKTLLAKAIAGEVECPFISVCASEFIEMFVGAGAGRVRDLFAKAKELAPCILFIDEFDALAKKRSSVSFGGGADEHSQTLNQLLSLMDGFDMQKHPIIVLAATNRVDVLDPAVIRPGRFDRVVEVSKPYFKDRVEILKVHLQNIKTDVGINIPLVARATVGFSGAELANLVNEAAILAVNDKSSCVYMKHIDQAYDNITLGREIKGMEQIDEDLWETAIHEAGHSIVRVFLEHAQPLYKVTITPRGRALGISFSRPLREKYSWNEEEMKAQIIVALAGTLAEKEFGFSANTGRRSDLAHAQDIARDMVALYGMSDELGYMNYVDSHYGVSSQVQGKIDALVKKVIDECYEKSQRLVTEHRKEIELLAKMLMEQGTVFGDVVYNMCKVAEPNIDYGLVQ